MAYLVLAGFFILVAGLTLASLRTGRPTPGCCAPADPALDLRMREAPDEN